MRCHHSSPTAVVLWACVTVGNVIALLSLIVAVVRRQQEADRGSYGLLLGRPIEEEVMSSLTEIQQAFVRRYMDDSVIGVRVQKIDDEMMLVVEVDDPTSVELPQTFRDLAVRVRTGRRAVLAYS